MNYKRSPKIFAVCLVLAVSVAAYAVIGDESLYLRGLCMVLATCLVMIGICFVFPPVKSRPGYALVSLIAGITFAAMFFALSYAFPKNSVENAIFWFCAAESILIGMFVGMIFGQ